MIFVGFVKYKNKFKKDFEPEFNRTFSSSSSIISDNTAIWIEKTNKKGLKLKASRLFIPLALNIVVSLLAAWEWENA